jgi:precorrin-2 dehydrogenase/sirohydrochlorin ferrochelatase
MGSLSTNPLYPIFIKMDQISLLVVGGGYVALEKLTFLFKSSPNARVTIVAPMIRPETESTARENNVCCVLAEFRPDHLDGHQMVIACTDQPKVNMQIYTLAKKRGILVNTADNPPYCDFYMGAIVNKGALKVAISTNGTSPTLAKRMRQWLEEVLPDEVDELLTNLRAYRSTLKGDFEQKVHWLNEHTKSLLEQEN